MTQVPAELDPVVHALFGDRLPLAVRYADHLATTGIERGLIGPREAPRLWDRHLVNCAAVAELIPAESRVADVGSGAGLPGVVLAIARPDLHLTLVEPLLRRTVWLDEVVTDLALTNVTVRRGRAAELSGLEVEVVTARAVAELGKLWDWCGALLPAGGRVLALKGLSAEKELQAVSGALPGAAGAVLRCCEVGAAAPPTVVVEVTRDGSPWPGRRRVGGPRAQRPARVAAKPRR